MLASSTWSNSKPLTRCMVATAHGVAAAVVRAAVEVVDVAVGQERRGPAARLFRGAVVQLQLARAAVDVDAATPERHAPAAVDALVAIAGDEEVVAARRRDDAQQAKLRRTHVLRFVHDRGGVAESGGVRRFAREQRRGFAVGIVHFLHAALCLGRDFRLDLAAELLIVEPCPKLVLGKLACVCAVNVNRQPSHAASKVRQPYHR